MLGRVGLFVFFDKEVEVLAQAEKKIDTREALIEAAKELFTLKGFSAVSTREIANKASVNLGSITYHFGSKAQLFVATIRELMNERHERLKLCCRQVQREDRKGAAVELCRFMGTVLSDMCHPEGHDVCRIMHREIYGATSQDPELYEALVKSVTDEFIQPIDSHLQSLLRTIRPEAKEKEIWMLVQSVIGQLSFYVTHRPFTDRLRGKSLIDEEVDDIGQYIAAFTLRGLGFNEVEIAEIFEQVERVDG